MLVEETSPAGALVADTVDTVASKAWDEADTVPAEAPSAAVPESTLKEAVTSPASPRVSSASTVESFAVTLAVTVPEVGATATDGAEAVTEAVALPACAYCMAVAFAATVAVAAPPPALTLTLAPKADAEAVALPDCGLRSAVGPLDATVAVGLPALGPTATVAPYAVAVAAASPDGAAVAAVVGPGCGLTALTSRALGNCRYLLTAAPSWSGYVLFPDHVGVAVHRCSRIDYQLYVLSGSGGTEVDPPVAGEQQIE